jgi:peptidoglycan/LPS O-acetylase OafA/YrhL
LAEGDHSELRTNSSAFSLWHWRLAIWFFSWLCSVLRFHSPVGYPWTLNLFGVAVFFWLQKEIAAAHDPRKIRLWEWAGKWSYSIYLMHSIANVAFESLQTPNLGPNLNWVQRVAFILLIAYLFYLIVEKPGHWIARRLGKLISKRKSQASNPPKIATIYPVPTAAARTTAAAGSEPPFTPAT